MLKTKKIFIFIILIFIILIAGIFLFLKPTKLHAPESVLENKTNLEKTNPFGVFPDSNLIDGLESAKELGINNTRLILSWNQFEPTKNKFNFAQADSALNNHTTAGISPIVTIKSDSAWGSKAGHLGATSSAPLDWTAYENFLKTAVLRYKDQVKYWQIENEIYDNSQYWKGTREEYIETLKHAHSIIKQTDPEAKIVLQGFADMMFIMINNDDKKIESFLDYIMSNGQYFDVIDFHQYFEPDTIYIDMTVLRKVMNKYNLSKPIICTEAGGLDLRLFGQQIQSASNPTIPEVPIIKKLLSVPSVSNELKNILKEGVSEKERIDFGIFLKTDQQARLILEKYQAEDLTKRIGLTFSQDVQIFNWFSIIDSEKPSEWFFSHLGLIDSNGRKKPHFFTYKILIEKLKGFNKAEEVSFNPRIIKFSFSDKPPVFIAWNQEPTTVNMEKYFSDKNIILTHIVTSLDKKNNPVYLPDEIVSPKSIRLDETPILLK